MTRQEKLNKLAFDGWYTLGSLWGKWLWSNEPLNFEEWIEQYHPEELEGLTDE